VRRRRGPELRGFAALYDAAAEHSRTTYRNGVADGMRIALRLIRGEEVLGVHGYPGPLPPGLKDWLDRALGKLPPSSLRERRPPI
jgi:hypothetical protein